MNPAEGVARLEELLAAAPDVLAADRIGLVLLDDRDRLRAVGASDGPADEPAGPAHDAVRTGEVVTGAAADGRPMLAVPVRVHGRTAGALTATRAADGWSPDERRAVLAYADVVATVLGAHGTGPVPS